MILTVHERECSIERFLRPRKWDRCVHWAEYTFAPLALAAWTTEPSWTTRAGEQECSQYRHFRGASFAVACVVPVGSRVVRRECPAGSGRWEDRLVVWFDRFGLDAETVARLAHRGQRGFAIARGEGDSVARKKRTIETDEPGLFGAEPEPPPVNGAYGNAPKAPAERLADIAASVLTAPAPPSRAVVRAEVEAIARECLAAERERYEDLRQAVRRAIELLERPADRGDEARYLLALALDKASTVEKRIADVRRDQGGQDP